MLESLTLVNIQYSVLMNLTCFDSVLTLRNSERKCYTLLHFDFNAM